MWAQHGDHARDMRKSRHANRTGQERGISTGNHIPRTGTRYNHLDIRLPSDKLMKLKALVSAWRGRKACKKRELLSLLGLLTHAGRAVKPGRSYVRRLIDLSTKTRQLDHYVRINKEAKADIEWWHCFLNEWNGIAMMWPGPRHPTDVVVTSDATGTWGCGAYCGKEWFMVPRTALYIHHHITVKELALIAVSAIVWGAHGGENGTVEVR